MREIKFRAWIGGDWIKGGPQMIPWSSEFFSDESPVTGWGSDFPSLENTDVILMQYTGLKDKNGREIYESDLIVTSWGRPEADRENLIYEEVVFISGGWFVEIGPPDNRPPRRQVLYAFDSDDLEVIGNIYENPEIFKKKAI